MRFRLLLLLLLLLLPAMLFADPDEWVLWMQSSQWTCRPLKDCHLITYPLPVWDYRQATETQAACEAIPREEYDLVHDSEVTILVSVGKRTVYVTRFVCVPSGVDPKTLNQEDPAGGRWKPR